jgi:hypothetical protein
MDHDGVPCPACRKPTDVVAGWVHVDDVTLEVDPSRYNCPHCGAAFFIALNNVEQLGDEQVPHIVLTLAA